MSEFHVRVVRVGVVDVHPNADSLSMTNIDGGYPVVFKSGNFTEGDLAVYIPMDAMVPTDTPAFTFLQSFRCCTCGKSAVRQDDWTFVCNNEACPTRLAGASTPTVARSDNGYARIQAKRLRGIFSMGMLLPVKAGWVEGQNVQEELGITRYEPPIDLNLRGDSERDLGYLPEYTDIEGLRRYPEMLSDNEEVVLTEKIHGTNFRARFCEGRLWIGSHHQIKKESADSAYWQAARLYNLESVLSAGIISFTIIDQDKPKPVTVDLSQIVLYGEVYGRVQKGFGYGHSNAIKLAFFDAQNISTRKYLDYDVFIALCATLGLPVVPELYRGPWNSSLLDFANGTSTLDSHIREGFVVRPVVERFDPQIGRVILKRHGDEFLLKTSR